MYSDATQLDVELSSVAINGPIGLYKRRNYSGEHYDIVSFNTMVHMCVEL